MYMSPEEFKAAMSRWVTGVAVITARSRSGELSGLTASSFASVSLDPPLVLFCLGHASTSKAAFQETDGFAVNILGAGQQSLASGFAKQGGDKFVGIGWRPGLRGVPLLDDALAQLECRIEIMHPGGDHLIVVGEVERIDVREDKPLVYYRGTYHGI
jgi:flavin reductase (DIM6/NTAB) family NADH-FMN oxidoreductase RutF